ncbi:4-hydroxybenzoate transporter, partial [Rhizobiaceae sp. 2RAB30]
GWAIGIGRTGAIVGSAVGGWLLQTGGVGGYFLGLAVPLAIAAGAVVLVRNNRKVPEPALAGAR